MTSTPFTHEQLVHEVRKLADERPNFIYSPPEGDSYCQYWHDATDTPGCIFGHALANLGVDVSSIKRSASIDVTLVEILGDDYNKIPDYVGNWFMKVQEYQDEDYPWRYAVDTSDMVLKERGIEL